jgi:YgiT-type zinc finger domain-containing protein
MDYRFQESKALLICLICRQAETVGGLTSVTFERGEMKLTVNNVPARVCPSCGEAYVEKDVAVELLQDAEKVSESGILDVVREYRLGD